MKTTIKAIAGKYLKPITLESIDEDKIKVTFSYDRNIIDEIKMMEGARWNPDEKYWTVKKSQHNQFAFEYLSGKNPFALYDAPLVEYTSKRKLFSHQLNMICCALTRKQLILAAEQGTGKTLAAIEVAETLKDELKSPENFWWIGPKSALRAVELEFLKWRSEVWPRFITYDSLKKCINAEVPRIIVFDEASKLKTPTAQRTQAARLIADRMRTKYGKDAYIILMTGTPAPNSPADWWSLAATARPGFLKEGNYEKFKRRLGLIVQKESPVGGVYPELITWLDNEKKCKICGKYEDALEHFPITNNYHIYEKSINEVNLLYQRLKGLVVIHLKKDVLKELPEKHYRVIHVTPSEEILRAAKLILATAKNVVTANVLLRELSDGFQYKSIESGTLLCETCNGNKRIVHPVCIEWKCDSCGIEGEDEYLICPKCDNPLSEDNKKYVDKEIDCLNCGGVGEVPKIDRTTLQLTKCPKDDILIELLEEHEEVGRLIVYAGFTGSVDRVVKICLEQEWNVVRVDGRGWWSNWGNISEVGMLKEFLKMNANSKEKIVFVGQADAAGMGLTLTSSPSAFYFSNTFKAESRMQSMDRGHRPGMDLNKGFTIIDIIHLPSDQKVLDSLNAKKDLQSMSLGDFQSAFDKERTY